MGAQCSSKKNTAMAKLTDIKDKTLAKLNKKKEGAKDGENAGLISGEDANELLGDAKDALKESGIDANKIIGDNVDPGKILSGAIDNSGLKEQLKEQGLTDEKIANATEQASRYIKPEAGADQAQVEKEVTENPDVQEFIGKLRAVSGDDAGADADKPISPEEAKGFLDSIKGNFGGVFEGKSKEEVQKDAEKAASGDTAEMAKLASKYFSADDVTNLVKNHGDDIQKMVEKQGGVSGITNKLQEQMEQNKPAVQRVNS